MTHINLLNVFMAEKLIMTFGLNTCGHYSSCLLHFASGQCVLPGQEWSGQPLVPHPQSVRPQVPQPCPLCTGHSGPTGAVK